MKKLLVILAAIALVGAFTATSIAAEWNFYGSSRLTTMRYDKSKELAGVNYDDQDTSWLMQTNSRFGAKVKASDAVEGRMELSMSSQSQGLRLLYGKYNFGSGSLLVGQDYTPVDQILSTSVGALATSITAAGTNPVADGGGNALQIGSFYESRLPQVTLFFGDFKLAFIQMATVAPENQGTYTDVDTSIPKIEVNYTFKTDTFSITPYAGYNTVDFTNTVNDSSVSVDSYVVGAAGKFNFGPMYLKANIFWAQNAKNYGRSTADLDSAAVIVGSDTEDAETWGGQVIAGWKMNDMFGFEAGYSYDDNEVSPSGITYKNAPSQYYINATITLAPGVFIVPEIGYFDFGDQEITGQPTQDLGDCTYYGAKWQINF